VWRALTEARVVLGWLPTANFLVTDDSRFTFRAAGLAGLDEQIEGHIVTSERPHRLVMRWEAPNLHTLLSMSLQPTDAGCHLSLVQRGFLGAQGTMRRRVLHRTYTELFSGPFQAALERLAAEEARVAAAGPARAEHGRRNDGRAFQRLPRQADGRGGTPPRSASAPGLTSYVRVAAGPKHTVAMPGLAAAVLGAQAAGRPASDPARGGPDQAVGVVPAGHVAKLTDARRHGWLVRAGRTTGRLLAAGWRHLRGVPSWSPERRSQAVAASAAALLLLAMVALLLGRATIVRPPDPPQVGGQEPGPLQVSVPAPPSVQVTAGPSLTASSAPAELAASSTAGAAARTGLTPSPSGLTAAYKTEDVRVSGYDATITIQNPTGQAVRDWTVRLSLQLLDLRVRDVEGATAKPGRNEVIFTPVEATRSVSAGGSVKVSFRVDGLGRPTACSIDGRPCHGIPE
jgi:uncharacterized protein YndB with AHSA1/START domain